MSDTPIFDELAYQIELTKTAAAIESMNRPVSLPDRPPIDPRNWLTRYVTGRRS